MVNGGVALEIWDWLRAFVALVATLALIGLAAVAARRFGLAQTSAFGAPKRMKVRERLMLDPRRQLVIVQADGEEHVLLLSPFGDRRIATRPALAEPDPKPGEGDPA